MSELGTQRQRPSTATPAILYDGADLGISDCKRMALSYLSWVSSKLANGEKCGPDAYADGYVYESGSGKCQSNHCGWCASKNAYICATDADDFDSCESASSSTGTKIGNMAFSFNGH